MTVYIPLTLTYAVTLSSSGSHRKAEEAGAASGGGVGRAVGQAEVDPRGAGSAEGSGEAAAASGGCGEQTAGAWSRTSWEAHDALASHRAKILAVS